MTEETFFGSIPPIQFRRPRHVSHPESPSHSQSQQQRSLVRGMDQPSSRLSPTSTLEALSGPTNVMGRLDALSISDPDSVPASATEQSFGLRAAQASRRVRDWHVEVSSWQWPLSGTHTSATAFQESWFSMYERKWHQSQAQLNNPEGHTEQNIEVDTTPPGQRAQQGDAAKEQQDSGVTEKSSDGPFAEVVNEYHDRIRSIREGLDELDLDDLKHHVLDAYRPLRSRPSSSEEQKYSMTDTTSTTQLNKFTAVATITILQLLPLVAQLSDLLDRWCLRLSVLHLVPLFLKRLRNAQIALESGWSALNVLEGQIPRWDEQLFGKPEQEKAEVPTAKSEMGNIEGKNTAPMAPQSTSDLTRGEYNIMRLILEDKIASAGQPLDRMLDALEGQEDTLPGQWIDRMEEIERDYGNWVVEAEKILRMNEVAYIADLVKSGEDLGPQSKESDEAPEVKSKGICNQPGLDQIHEQGSHLSQPEVAGSPSIAITIPSKEALSSSNSELKAPLNSPTKVVPQHEYELRPKSAPANSLLLTSFVHSDQVPVTKGQGEVGDVSSPWKTKLEPFLMERAPADESLERETSSIMRKRDMRYDSTSSLLSPQLSRRAISSKQGYESGVKPVRQRSLPSLNTMKNPSTPSEVALTGLWLPEPGRKLASYDNDTSDNIKFSKTSELGAEPGQIAQAELAAQGINTTQDISTLAEGVMPRSEQASPEATGMADMTTRVPFLGLTRDGIQKSPSSGPGLWLNLVPAGQPSRTTTGRSGTEYPGALSSQSSPSSDLSSPELRDAVAAVYHKPIVVAARPSSYIGLISPLRTSLPPLGGIEIQTQNHDENSSTTRMTLRRRSISYPARHSARLHPNGSLEENQFEHQLDHAVAKRASVVSIESVDMAAVRNIILRKSSLVTSGFMTPAGDTAEPEVTRPRSPPLTSPATPTDLLQGPVVLNGGDPNGLSEKTKVTRTLTRADLSPDPSTNTIGASRDGLNQPLANENHRDTESIRSLPPAGKADVLPHVGRGTARSVIDAVPSPQPSDIGKGSSRGAVKKSTGEQLKDKISSILTTIPAQIQLTSEDDPSSPETSNKLSKPANPGSAPRSRKGGAGLNSYTLAPAKTNSPAPRAGSDGPEVRLYHLRRAGVEAPIKLFVRLVGEPNHQRVMVRVGGGWADLGEYLREYATHHGRRSTSDRGGLVEVKQLTTSTPPSSSRPQPRDGRSTPTWNSYSRPSSVLGYSNPQPQGRPQSRPSSSSSSQQAPNTPTPLPFAGPLPFATDSNSTPLPTPPGNRPMSRHSLLDETSIGPSMAQTGISLAGPKRGKRSEPLSAEKEAWVEDMIGKVRRGATTAGSSTEASPAEKKGRRKSELEFGDLGAVGNVKRIFKRGESFAE